VHIFPFHLLSLSPLVRNKDQSLRFKISVIAEAAEQVLFAYETHHGGLLIGISCVDEILIRTSESSSTASMKAYLGSNPLQGM